jgi:molybdate transport system ATP-binding protein
VVLSDGKCLAVGDVDEVMGRRDLKPATGRYEAGSVVDTRVTAHDAEDQLTTLAFDGGELIVPRLDVPIGVRVRARIRARDVSLSLRKPTEISILNVLAAHVTGIGEETGPIVDLQLAVGNATLVARITRRSFQQLGICPGQELYALVKAVSFDQRSVGYA